MNLDKISKCRRSARYRAKREPKCGCDLCMIKWRFAQIERQLTRLSAQMESIEKLAGRLHEEAREETAARLAAWNKVAIPARKGPWIRDENPSGRM